MKLVLLMYLEDDAECVSRLLKNVHIEAFSGLPVEGHVPGATGGWYGTTAPYHSRMIVSVLPDDQARLLVEAVGECTGVKDPRHPIRAVMMNVEAFSCCDSPETGEAT